MRFLLAALAGAAIVSAVAIESSQEKFNYDGYKVLRMDIENEDEARRLTDMVDNLGLSWWKMPGEAGDHATVQIPPDQVSAFEAGAAAAAFRNIEVVHEDLGYAIFQESNVTDTYEPGSNSMNWFGSYHTWDQHHQWFKDIQAKYPKNSAMVSMGTSAEGKDIFGIHIWGSAKGKKAFVMTGTIHAREWIVGKVIEYNVQGILEEMEKDEMKPIMEKFDFFIYPFVNPDGFIFTSNSRMWRKNRAKTDKANCLGIDCNRNFDAKWGGPGASKDPCHEMYHGPSAASEPETKAIQNTILEISKAQGVAFYIDWHSYGQMILSPYGYNCQTEGPRFKEHLTHSNANADALKAVHGTQFRTGSACKVLYQLSGSSTDWAVDSAKVEFAYLQELRDKSGFVIKPELIKPSGEEAWAGIKAMMKSYIKTNYA